MNVIHTACVTITASLTSDSQFSGALSSPHCIFSDNLVLSGVFGADPQYEQGTDATGIRDVVVGVGVEADVVAEPSHMWRRVPFDGAAHVTLVSLWGGMQFQRNNELRGALEVANLG